MANSPANTTQLQALLDEGDDAAYGELLSIASTRLHKLARKMLRDFPKLRRWEQTDDVFKTAAMKLQRSLSEVKPESVRRVFGLAATQMSPHRCAHNHFASRVSNLSRSSYRC